MNSCAARRWIAGVFLLVIASAALANAQHRPPSEYEVKAACLVSFPKYVEWPARSFANKTAPLILGIYGQNRFRGEAWASLTNKTIVDREILLAHGDASPGECHIVFISGSEKHSLPEILSALKDVPVLTVGECEGFLEQGGIINFVMKDRKVRLQVNLVAAERAGLRISAKLLAVADVVIKP